MSESVVVDQWTLLLFGAPNLTEDQVAVAATYVGDALRGLVHQLQGAGLQVALG
jgi:hypothetical protein